MRKIVTLLLSIIFILAMSTNVYATDKERSGSSQVYAKIENLFSVRIPAEIDLRNGDDKSTVTINNARIGSDKVINVYCMNCVGNGIELTHTTKANKKIGCTITNLELNQEISEDIPMCSFEADDIEDMTATKEFGLEAETIGDVGEYSGLMLYGFAIE